MSGAMPPMPAQQGMPQGGPPPGPPQGAPPPMPPRPQGPPPQPQPTMQPPPPQGIPPNLAMFGRAAQAQPQAMGAQQGAQVGLRPHEAAAMGRGGDTIIAHLTPGEIVIPKFMQSPQLMQALRQAFLQAGAQPAQFVVGAPQAPKNPHTGMEEHNGLFGDILPAALGLGASIFAPEILPALGLTGIGAGAASAIGGGLGTALGSALSGGNAAQSLTSGLGAAGGSALAGSLGGSGAAAGSGSGDAANFPSPSTTPFGSPQAATMAGQYAQGDGASSLLGGASGVNPPGANPGTIGSGGGGLAGMLSGGDSAPSWLRGVGAAAGGALGGALSATPKSTALPQPGPTPVYNPSGPNPNSGAAGRPNFTGYNPYAAVQGSGYNFYPVPPPG